jgi:hypothetical protein
MQQNATVYDYKYNMKYKHAENFDMHYSYLFYVPSNGKPVIKNFYYSLFET